VGAGVGVKVAVGIVVADGDETGVGLRVPVDVMSAASGVAVSGATGVVGVGAMSVTGVVGDTAHAASAQHAIVKTIRLGLWCCLMLASSQTAPFCVNP